MTPPRPKSPIDAFHRATARRLRERATSPEQRLWNALRGVPTVGTHFRRQVPIGPYVADIACLARRLVIEVDGSQHGSPKAMRSDGARTAWLETEGYRVLRFWNSDVASNVDDVVEAIYDAMYGDGEIAAIEHRRSRSMSAAADSTPPRRAPRADPPPPGEGRA